MSGTHPSAQACTPDALLWWLPGSHYSEKIRWYLDAREIPHRQRSAPPFVHSGIALALTRGRGYTFPIMRFDGDVLSDSAEIITVLETRIRDRQLLPRQAPQRHRVLELQRFFDTTTGVAARHFLHEHTVHDDAAIDALLPAGVPPSALARAVVRRALRLRLGIGTPGAKDRALAGVYASLDRIEHQLAGREYLVDNTFTVADLTGAALLSPLVQPPGSPALHHPASLREFVLTLHERPAYNWVQSVYRHHRTRAPAALDGADAT